MKKLIFGIAALSLLFAATSCSNETRESVDDLKNQISFRAAIGKQTRASEFTLSSWAVNDQLTVKAYPVNSTVLTNNFTLTYQGGSAWDYPTPFNQPGFALRYYSYYPADKVTTPAVTAGSYTFGYTIQAVAAQQDLIAATVTTNATAVELPFTHILSQVNFALTKVPGVKIMITNISVNGVKNKGTYTFGATTPWTLDTSIDTYAYEPVAGTNITDGTTSGTSYLGNGSLDKTQTNALMLMPQSFAAQTDGTFSFDYELIPVNSDGSDGTPITGSVIANLCDFELSTWAQGKRYIYLIDFSAFLAGGPITFTVTVAPWADATPYLAAETLYVADATLLSIETAIAKHSAENNTNMSLTVFPIAVPTDLAAATVIANIPGFDKDDQIRIEFQTSTGAAQLSLDSKFDATWTRNVTDRVVILTKN